MKTVIILAAVALIGVGLYMKETKSACDGDAKLPQDKVKDPGSPLSLQAQVASAELETAVDDFDVAHHWPFGKKVWTVSGETDHIQSMLN